MGKGWAVGPFSESEVSEFLGCEDWVCSRRFGVDQGLKKKPDGARASRDLGSGHLRPVWMYQHGESEAVPWAIVCGDEGIRQPIEGTAQLKVCARLNAQKKSRSLATVQVEPAQPVSLLRPLFVLAPFSDSSCCWRHDRHQHPREWTVSSWL